MSSRTTGPIGEKLDINDLASCYVYPWCAYCVWWRRVELGNGRDDRVIQGYREDIRYCYITSCPYWESRPCQKPEDKQ
jgi:hypothetical protein